MFFPLFSSQSSVQDWGEEVEEGAIYNVTLKRVQIQQAANKGARWLGVSMPPPSDVSCTVTESLSQPVAVKNANSRFFEKVEHSLMWNLSCVDGL